MALDFSSRNVVIPESTTWNFGVPRPISPNQIFAWLNQSHYTSGAVHHRVQKRRITTTLDSLPEDVFTILTWYLTVVDLVRLERVSKAMKTKICCRAVWLYAVMDARRAQAKVHCPPFPSLSLRDLKDEAIAAVDVSTRFKNGVQFELILNETETDIFEVTMLPGLNKYMLLNGRCGRLELRSQTGGAIASHDVPIAVDHYSCIGHAQISSTLCYAWKVVSHSVYPHDSAPAEVHLYHVGRTLTYAGCYAAPHLVHGVALQGSTLIYGWVDASSRCYLKIVELSNIATDPPLSERIIQLEATFTHYLMRIKFSVALINNDVALIGDVLSFAAFNLNETRSDEPIRPFWRQPRRRPRLGVVREVPLLSQPIMIAPAVARCIALVGSEIHAMDIPLGSVDDAPNMNIREVVAAAATGQRCLTSGSGVYRIGYNTPDPNQRNGYIVFSYYAGRSPRSDDFVRSTFLALRPEQLARHSPFDVTRVACSEDITRIAVLETSAVDDRYTLYVWRILT